MPSPPSSPAGDADQCAPGPPRRPQATADVHPQDQRAVWEQIGASFDAARRTPWPLVVTWLRTLPPGSCIVDSMAGNGRHAAAAKDLGHSAICIDSSRALCRAALARGLPVVQADATRLPVPDRSFDAALYIAGLHGLASEAGRAASLSELWRVLRRGGSALVTVWSRGAPRFGKLPGRGPVDVVVPWRRDGLAAQRHYHLYTADALRTALEQAGFEVVVCREEAVAGGAPDNVVAQVRR